MADRGVDVERIDRAVADRVDAVEELAELHEVAVVLGAAGTPAAVAVGAVGRPADRREGDPLAAELHVVRRVARPDGELGRRRGQRMLYDLAADPHPLAIDQSAGAAEDLARLG